LGDGKVTGSCYGNARFDQVTPLQTAFLTAPAPCSSCHLETTVSMRVMPQMKSGPITSSSSTVASVLDRDHKELNKCSATQTCQIDSLGVAQCMDLSASDACAATTCTEGTMCIVNDQGQAECVAPSSSTGGIGFDGSGGNTGGFVDDCETHQCPDGFVCNMVQVSCVADPCPPEAQCVPGPGSPMLTNNGGGGGAGANGLIDTVSCAGLTCASDETCQLQQVACIRAPCAPAARCVCATQCPMLDKPVCGVDKKMYANECELNVSNCERRHAVEPQPPVTIQNLNQCLSISS